MMRKYSNLLLLLLTITIILSGCNGAPIEAELTDAEQVYTSDEYALDDIDFLGIIENDYVENVLEQVDATTNVESNAAETEDEYAVWEDDALEAVGGDWDITSPHVHFFDYLTMFSMSGLFASEEIRAWSMPLWEQVVQTGEPLVNVYTFIQHFNVSREVFEEVISHEKQFYFWFGGETTDVLYSGNWALVDQFFLEGGQASYLAMERENRYFSERIMAAQQLVNENATWEMSRYFHDIWTYLHFSNGKSHFYRLWMRDLVEAGEYNRVNIVDFINHFGLDRPSSLSPGRTIFEHWVRHDNMNIFTHYNLDILLSGSWTLIREYYSIENEHLHTAAVQARFDAHVERYGMPDTSWMLPRDTTTQPTNTIYVSSHAELLAAVASAPTTGELLTIIATQSFSAAAGNPITIPTGANITFTSQQGNTFTYTQTNSNRRHFMVNGNLTLENITISGNPQSTVNHGGIEVRDGGHLMLQDGSTIANNRAAAAAGGVHISGANSRMTMYGGIISGNHTNSAGGGVYASRDAEFTMYGGTIEGNFASRWGGGVRVHNGSVFNLHNGTIHNNTSNAGGGGVAGGANSVFTMHGGAITDNNVISTPTPGENSSFGNGGGVLIDGTVVFTMNGGEISGNTAAEGFGVGGGVAVLVNGSAGRFNMQGGEIFGNQAANGGGVAIRGVTNATAIVMNITGGEITQNTAANNGGGIYWLASTALRNVAIGSGAAVYNNHASAARIDNALNQEHGSRINPGTVTEGFEHAFNNLDIKTGE